MKKGLVPALRFPEFKEDGKWEKKELSSALDAESSQIAKNTLQLVEKGYPIYGADGMLGFVSSYIQEKDYIAIVKDGSGVGNLFFYKDKSSLLGTLNYLTSKDDEKHSLKWLYYLLQTISFKPFVKGSGIPHIYYKDYSKLLVLIPSLKEQQKIASCLSCVDNLIEAQTKKIETLKDHKKGLLQQLFPTEGETIPQLRFPEFKEDGEWDQEKLSNICNIANGKSNAQDHVDDGEFPLFDRSEVIKASTKYLFDCEAVILPGEGMRFIPKHYSGKFDLHQRAYALMDFSCNGLFAYYSMFVNSNLLVSKAVLSTVLSLRLPILLNFPILIPKTENEQQKIASCLSSIDDLIEAQTKKMESLKAHKKGLMQQLFPAAYEVGV